MKASEVIRVAETELGYHEKASGSNLDSKTANSGYYNYTKYARDLAAAGYYQASKQGYEWCDCFVDWCVFQAAGKNKVAAEKAECQDGTLYGAGCTYSRSYYKSKGRLSSTPKVGDQAFFSETQRNAPSNADHTGIVVAVNGNAVTVIEGNKNNQVERNTYHIGDGWLYDFGHPFYDPEDEHKAQEQPKTEVKEVAITYTVKAGDTLYRIANEFGTTIGQIAADNQIVNPNLIYVGQKLMINATETYEEAPASSEPAAFKVGDKVRMADGAKVYGKSYGFASWVYQTPLYVRQISGDAILVSTVRTGAVTGWVDKAALKGV